MTHDMTVYLVSVPLALLFAMLLIHKVEQRRQRRQSWWRGR